ncbi:MAG: hypothetical protein SGJ27_26910 [Candidatus Melainabacteria bacterium]|nr:hypothetical protein [Candidatus Melainabacteria bacterium]
MWNSKLLAPVLAVPVSIRIAVAAVSICAVALTAGYYATASDTIEDHHFPTRLPIQAELHDGEDLRNVDFYEDGITPRNAVAYNSDGTTTNYAYRVDGTLKVAETIKTLENGKAIVIRRADIMPDGVTYEHDVEYFDDGVQMRKENRLVDAATQHRKYFYANGAIRSNQTIVFDSKSYSKKGWKLFIESTYRVDSTLASTFKLLEDDGYERNTYSDKGVLVASTKMGRWETNYEEATFQADGKTPIRVMKQDHQSTEVLSYRVDGSLAERRQWFGALTSAMMTVTEYDTRGIRVLSRNYMSQSDKFRLYTITEYTADGKDELRNIYFEIGGAASETNYSLDGESGWTRRLFSVSGYLEKEMDVIGGKGTVATREYTEADNIRLNLKPEWLVMTEFETPKQIIPYVPQGMHH